MGIAFFVTLLLSGVPCGSRGRHQPWGVSSLITGLASGLAKCYIASHRKRGGRETPPSLTKA